MVSTRLPEVGTLVVLAVVGEALATTTGRSTRIEGCGRIVAAAPFETWTLTAIETVASTVIERLGIETVASTVIGRLGIETVDSVGIGNLETVTAVTVTVTVPTLETVTTSTVTVNVNGIGASHGRRASQRCLRGAAPLSAVPAAALHQCRIAVRVQRRHLHLRLPSTHSHPVVRAHLNGPSPSHLLHPWQHPWQHPLLALPPSHCPTFS